MDVGKDSELTSDGSFTVEAECRFGDFAFTKVGEYVAVFYDSDFHIGSVSEIYTPHQARVNFLRKCAVANNAYVWPNKPEEDKISSIYM